MRLRKTNQLLPNRINYLIRLCGHFHLIGGSPQWILLVAEGYATAATGIEAGPIWRQVLASLLAYKAFLAIIAAAWAWRGLRFRKV